MEVQLVEYFHTPDERQMNVRAFEEHLQRCSNIGGQREVVIPAKGHAVA